MGGLLGCTTPFIWTMPGLPLTVFPVLLPAGLSLDGLLLLAVLPLSPFLRDIPPSVRANYQCGPLKLLLCRSWAFAYFIAFPLGDDHMSHWTDPREEQERICRETFLWLPPWICRFLRVPDAKIDHMQMNKTRESSPKTKETHDSNDIWTVKKQLLKEKNRQRLLITWLARCLLFVDAKAPVAVRGPETPVLD